MHVDGEFVCAVSDAVVARWRLHRGRELDEHDLDSLRGDASRELVMADAYRLLGHRARSREELRRRLLAKEHTPEAVEASLDALVTDGFLDDAKFACSYVADKRHLAGWGAERIRRGLSALGVESAVIDGAVGDVTGEESGDAELDRALALLTRRGAPQPPLDAARRRAYQALQRRGFASGVAYAAVRRWSGEGGGSEQH